MSTVFLGVGVRDTRPLIRVHISPKFNGAAVPLPDAGIEIVPRWKPHHLRPSSIYRNTTQCTKVKSGIGTLVPPRSVSSSLRNSGRYSCSLEETLNQSPIPKALSTIFGSRVQCSVPKISCLNSTAEAPGSQGTRAQATCVWSASEGNVARRDKSSVEW